MPLVPCGLEPFDPLVVTPERVRVIPMAGFQLVHRHRLPLAVQRVDLAACHPVRDRLVAEALEPLRIPRRGELAFPFGQIHRGALLQVALGGNGTLEPVASRLVCGSALVGTGGVAPELSGRGDRVEVEATGHGPAHLGREELVVARAGHQLRQREQVAMSRVIGPDVRWGRVRSVTQPRRQSGVDLGVPALRPQHEPRGNPRLERADGARPQDHLDRAGHGRLAAAVGAEHDGDARVKIRHLESLALADAGHPVYTDTGQLEPVDRHGSPPCC